MLRVLAPAKVNLHLSVGSVRPDGYHDLTSVFHTLELCDELTMEPAPHLAVHCEPDVGVDPERNLAYVAAVRMGESFDGTPAVRIALTKRIPHGAGLGGGSSDAAAVIVGLAALWGVQPDDPRCVAAAQSVGADVPFFLASSGAALMTGRGDHLQRSLPACAGIPVALVRPPFPVPTPAAYRAFDEDPQDTASPDAMIAALEAQDSRAVAGALFNNLESASIQVVSQVADALAWVKSARGVMGAAVSGSGSAVFALCESHAHAGDIEAAAMARGWWSLVTATGEHGARVVTP